MRALVIFEDDGQGFWAWAFGRPGFRHCFVALDDGRAWIIIDPLGHGTEVSADAASSFDLAAHYSDMGHTVLETRRVPEWRPYGAPWVFTCVEAVKRLLGIHGWLIWTPYQLYRHLEQTHGEHLLAAQAQGATAARSATDGRISGCR